MINCFCCDVIKSAGETTKKVLLCYLKYIAYRTKISFQLGYRAINARKYVRCARTFYLDNEAIYRIKKYTTAVEQAVAWEPVTQRVRVQSPVGTGFLGEFFRGFSSPVKQMSGNFRPTRSPNILCPP